MKIKNLFLINIAIFAIFMNNPPLGAQESSINTKLAAQYFKEAKELSDKDQEKLWGVPLNGPMIFVEPRSRNIVTNTKSRKGSLIKKDEVFVGKLSENIIITNNAINWEGRKWAMIIWPLPDDKFNREVLLIHGLWHRIQNIAGFPPTNTANLHFDSEKTHILLQLEWRALKKALLFDGAEKENAVEDALIFHHYKEELFPESKSDEISLLMNEGLAEYTGLKICSKTDSIFRNTIIRFIDEAEKGTDYVRSFANISGPAYCFLLDQTKTHWQIHLNIKDDMADLLQKAIKLEIPGNLHEEVKIRSEKYGGGNLHLE